LGLEQTQAQIAKEEEHLMLVMEDYLRRLIVKPRQSVVLLLKAMENMIQWKSLKALAEAATVATIRVKVDQVVATSTFRPII